MAFCASAAGAAGARPPRRDGGAGGPQQQPPRRSWPTRAAVAVGAGAALLALHSAFPPAGSASAPAVSKKKDLNYWQGMWDTNNLGWHKKSTHPTLKKFQRELLGGSAAVRVLVPLCGKTEDLAYLAAQPAVAEVVGVEAVPKALQEFAREHPKLRVAKAAAKQGAFDVYAGDKLRLLCGDIFKLATAHFFPSGPGGHRSTRFAAVWDRGALVALEPAQRGRYADIILDALEPGGRVLLVAVERVEGDRAARMNGPPFSVSEADVRALYGRYCTIRRLETLNVTDESPRWRNAGLTRVEEVTYLITKTVAKL